MSLVNCPECGRENVSDSAIACPICGYNVKEHYDNLKKQEEHKSQERLKLEELEQQKRLRQLAIQEQVERK